jgi:glycosyl hydrolase family 114
MLTRTPFAGRNSARSTYKSVRFLLTLLMMSGLLGAALVGQADAAPAEGNDISRPKSLQSSFPSTGLLDNFDRSDGPVGSNWSGTTSGYTIAGNQLDVNLGADIYWSPSLFGVDQEAYVTLSTIDTNAAEIDLILKSQSSTAVAPGQIQVVYKPSNNSVTIWTYSTSTGWQQQGTSMSATFINSDVLGARALSNGQVEVYKNSTLLGSRSVTSWLYYANGGYIGLFHLTASNTLLDNFGGGTLSGSPTLTPTSIAPTPTITSTVTSCIDPTTCNPVSAIAAHWKCNIVGCSASDWTGSVISWPSWSAYQTNARTGNNSRSVYSFQDDPLYPYMGSWAEGCQVTAVSGITLIIEWQRGTDTWRETYLNPGQSHTIHLISPENGAMIEAPDGVTSFSVSLANCNPQNIFTATNTPTATNTSTPSSTPSNTPTATFTPSSTSTQTSTPTSTPSNTPTATSTATNTASATSTPSNTPTVTSTPSHTPTATSTPSSTPTKTATTTFTPAVQATATATRTSNPNQPPLPTSASQKSEAIFPTSLTTQSGSVSGSLPSLRLIQQTGADDDPSAYVKFQTPGIAYMGYKSFFLPTDAQAGMISSMLLQVNFKGPSSTAQIWTWSIYDWSSRRWIRVGDTVGTPANEWNTLIFRIQNFTKYISPSREIRVRLSSNNQTNDARLDYQAIHITYEPVQPTPTQVIPTAVPTKPKYNFPATYTPTGTP